MKALVRRPVLIILAIFVAILFDVFLMGSTALPLIMSGVTPNGPYGYAGPRPEQPFSISIDPAGAYDAEFAWAAYFTRSVRSGALPLWNPYQGLGQPQLANYVPGVINPINWLTLVLPPAWWDLVFLVDWFLAAYFVYLVGRMFGFGRDGAIVGSLAICAGGFFAGFLAIRSIVGTVAWFPFLIYAIERALRQPGWRWKQVALAGGTYCLAAGGHPSPALIGLVLALLYTAVRVAIARGPWREIWLAILPSILLGGFLAAPLWLPFAEHVLRDSFPIHGEDQGTLHFPWRGLPMMVFPFLYGPVNLDAPWGAQYAGMTWTPASVTFLALVGLAGLVDRRKPALLALTVVVLLTAAKIYGVPIVNDIGRLPLLSQLSITYAHGFVAIGIAVLAGAGFVHLRREPLSRWLWLLAAWALFVVMMLTIGVTTMNGAAAVLAREPWRINHYRAALGAGMFWAVAFPLALAVVKGRHGNRPAPFLLVAFAGLALQAVACFPSGSPRGFVWLNLAAAAAFGFAAIVAAWLGSRLRATSAITISTLIVALTVAICTWNRPRLPGRYDPLLPAPYVDLLAAEPNAPRIHPLDGVLTPDFGAALGLSSMTNLDNLVTKQGAVFIGRFLDAGVHPARFYGLAAGRNPALPEPLAEFWAHKRYWDLVGVRYLLAAGRDLNGPQWRPDGQNADRLQQIDRDPRTGITVWENTRAADRALLAPIVEVVPNAEAAMAGLSRADDPRRTVFVEGQASCRGNRSFPPDAEVGRLLWLRLSPNRVDIRYDARTAGVLMLTDAHARGWRVTLDGQEASLLRVDGAFRGVCVDAPGVHTVEFVYRPPDWWVALALCATGAIGLALLSHNHQ